MPGRFIEVEEGAQAPELPKPPKEQPKEETKKNSPPQIDLIGTTDFFREMDTTLQEAESLGAAVARGFNERLRSIQQSVNANRDGFNLNSFFERTQVESTGQHSDIFPSHRVTTSIDKPTPVIELLSKDVVSSALSPYQLAAALQKAGETNHVLHPGDTWNFTLTSNLTNQSFRLILVTFPSPGALIPRQLSAPVPPPNRWRRPLWQRLAGWFRRH